jgi:hypothetical protein
VRAARCCLHKDAHGTRFCFAYTKIRVLRPRRINCAPFYPKMRAMRAFVVRTPIGR